MAGEESDIDATYLTQIDIAVAHGNGLVAVKSDGIGGAALKTNIKINTLSDGAAATPSIAFNDEKDTGFFRYVSGADSWIGVMVDGDISFYFAEGGNFTNSYRTIIPNPNNSIDMGQTSYRWKKGWFVDLHSTNAATDDSDKRLKDNILPNTLGLDFINDLNPVSYKWKDADIDTSTHYGVVAQDVIETLKKYGIDSLDDFGGITHDTEKDRYGARPTEFISILIKAVQELSAEVKQLKEKN